MEVFFLLLSILVFIFGTAIGSFLAAMAIRFNPEEEKKTIKDKLFTPSHCDSCGKRLKPIELIPIVSFILQKGKCSKCGKKIESSFFFIELISGLLALITFSLYLGSVYTLPMFIFVLVVSYIFIFLGYFDYLYWEIPLMMVIFVFVVYLIIFCVEAFIVQKDVGYIVNKFIALGIGMGVIIFAILLSKGKGLGWGDVWVLGLAGFLLGIQGVVIVFYTAIFSGSLIGIGKAIFVTKKIKGVLIQFIPFISFGVIVYLFIGEVIINYFFPFFQF